MKQVGTHLIVDAWDAPATRLDDPQIVRQALSDAVTACGATLIDLCVHEFNPVGVTATATLAESHMAIHTWPEHGYFAADLFFCGSQDPRPAMQTLLDELAARHYEIVEIHRGMGAGRRPRLVVKAEV